MKLARSADEDGSKAPSGHHLGRLGQLFFAS